MSRPQAAQVIASANRMVRKEPAVPDGFMFDLLDRKMRDCIDLSGIRWPPNDRLRAR
jgi:hypothetical protein